MKGAILTQKVNEIISLDKKNKEILQMLFNNSRMPLSKISKKTKISKQAILKRIKKLEDKKVILEYISYYNLINAGYSFYLILIETAKEKEQDFINKLIKNKFSASILKLTSKFNLCWFVFTKDKNHLNEILENINKNEIVDFKIFPITENYFDNYELFFNTEKKLNNTQDKIKLDSTDAEILNSLKDNSKISLVKIASKCNLSAEAVNQRIKKLVDKGIILRFFTNIQIFKLGFQPYLFLIKGNRSRQKEILEFVRRHKNTNGQYVLDNEYGLAFFLVVKDINELKEFINELNNSFKREIIDYQVYLIMDQFLNDFFPKGIYEDVKNKYPNKK